MGMKIEGMSDLRRVLDTLAPGIAKTVLRQTNHQVAVDVAKLSKENASDISSTGRMRKNIRAERKRGTPEQFVSEVHVKEKKGGASSLFYWRYVEKGTIQHPEQPFIRPAVDVTRPQLQRIYLESFGKKLEAALARQAKKQKAGK